MRRIQDRHAKAANKAKGKNVVKIRAKEEAAKSRSLKPKRGPPHKGRAFGSGMPVAGGGGWVALHSNDIEAICHGTSGHRQGMQPRSSSEPPPLVGASYFLDTGGHPNASHRSKSSSAADSDSSFAVFRALPRESLSRPDR